MRVLFILWLALYVCCAAENELKLANFSVDLPVGSAEKQGLVAMLYLPAKNGFAGNVNILIQDFSGTMKEYDDLTKIQIKQSGFIVSNAQFLGNGAKYEYAGKSQGFDCKWYARVEINSGKSYVITATGLALDWPDQETVLKKSVDSFKILKK